MGHLSSSPERTPLITASSCWSLRLTAMTIGICIRLPRRPARMRLLHYVVTPKTIIKDASQLFSPKATTDQKVFFAQLKTKLNPEQLSNPKAFPLPLDLDRFFKCLLHYRLSNCITRLKLDVYFDGPTSTCWWASKQRFVVCIPFNFLFPSAHNYKSRPLRWHDQVINHGPTYEFSITAQTFMTERCGKLYLAKRQASSLDCFLLNLCR